MSAMWGCQCGVFPIFEMEDGSATCQNIADFMDSGCTDEGIAMMGMTSCDCDCGTQCDCENCPAEYSTPYTKESLGKVLKQIHGLISYDTGAEVDSCA